jgi:hypothetical protein
VPSALSRPAPPVPCLRRTGIRIRALVLFGTAGLAFAAERPDSPFVVTTTPASGSKGPVVKVETKGPVSNRYQAFDVADHTTFDLRGAHIAGSPEHPMQNPFRAGEQERPPNGIHIIGGVVDGGMPQDWSWSLSHAFGGVGFYTVSTGLHVLEGARIHNVEDGWHPRETPGFKLRAYPNTARFLMRDCYMTGIRDDCIENDEFIPGAVEDSLFDGVWTLISEQNERQGGLMRRTVTTIGPDEDRDIHLTRVLVRVTSTSSREQKPGRWFKLIGRESPVHRFVITDCVFATDAEPRAGWRVLNFPKDATFRGTNYVLWLGQPGGYKADVPPGLKFLEGQAAKDKWHEVRNQWLLAHGYPPRSPNDWNPMEAPVAAPQLRR